MSFCKKPNWAGALLLPALIMLCSCSEQVGPQPGTPAFYWAAAKETFQAGDYTKTMENLDKVAGNKEYSSRAQPWLLVLTSGMAHGYMDLADAFESGTRLNRSDPASFRRYRSNYLSTAGRLSLRFAETFDNFTKTKDDPVVLAFDYPTGSPAQVLQLAKIGSGILQPAPELENGQKQAIERQVLLTTCRAVGAPGDTGKTLEIFKAGKVQVPRATFITAMANELYEQAQLYGRQKLDDPEKHRILCSRALEALKSVPATKETKALSSKIEKDLKKAKTT